jgi:hypothetical protein
MIPTAKLRFKHNPEAKYLCLVKSDTGTWLYEVATEPEMIELETVLGSKKVLSIFKNVIVLDKQL